MLSSKYAIYYLRINSTLTSPSCKEGGKNEPSGWKNNHMPSTLTPTQPVTETGPGGQDCTWSEALRKTK